MIDLAEQVRSIAALQPHPLPVPMFPQLPDLAAAPALSQIFGADGSDLVDVCERLSDARATMSGAATRARQLVVAARADLASIAVAATRRITRAMVGGHLPGSPMAILGYEEAAVAADQALSQARARVARLTKELEALATELDEAAADARRAQDAIPAGPRWSDPQGEADPRRTTAPGLDPAGPHAAATAPAADAGHATGAGAVGARPAEGAGAGVPVRGTSPAEEGEAAGTAVVTDAGRAGGSETGEAAVAAARSQLGAPYVWGGTSPSGFDCSGLTQWAYRQAGVEIPRTAEQQAIGTQVTADQLQPGDLVVWDGHVAMYAGDGQIIEAGDPVQTNPLRTSNMGMAFLGFYRPTG